MTISSTSPAPEPRQLRHSTRAQEPAAPAAPARRQPPLSGSGSALQGWSGRAWGRQPRVEQGKPPPMSSSRRQEPSLALPLPVLLGFPSRLPCARPPASAASPATSPAAGTQPTLPPPPPPPLAKLPPTAPSCPHPAPGRRRPTGGRRPFGGAAGAAGAAGRTGATWPARGGLTPTGCPRAQLQFITEGRAPPPRGPAPPHP